MIVFVKKHFVTLILECKKPTDQNWVSDQSWPNWSSPASKFCWIPPSSTTTSFTRPHKWSWEGSSWSWQLRWSLKGGTIQRWLNGPPTTWRSPSWWRPFPCSESTTRRNLCVTGTQSRPGHSSLLISPGKATNSIFFPVCKISLICLEAKLMTHHQEQYCSLSFLQWHPIYGLRPL